jgi:hypothetical protein
MAKKIRDSTKDLIHSSHNLVLVIIYDVVTTSILTIVKVVSLGGY